MTMPITHTNGATNSAASRPNSAASRPNSPDDSFSWAPPKRMNSGEGSPVLPRPHFKNGRSLLVMMALPLAVLTGCAGESGAVEATSTSAVTGALTTDTNQQGQLDSAASIANANAARLSVIEDDGSLTLMSTSTIDTDGRFTLKSNAEGRPMLVSVVDDVDVVVGEALVARGPQVDETVYSPAISTESTLETRVFLEMIEDGMPRDAIDVADLRSRIDGATAIAIRAERDDIEGQIEVIATAMASAHRVRTGLLRSSGVDVDSARSARTSAVSAWDARSAGAAGAAREDGIYLTELASIDAALGLAADESAHIESETSAATRLVMRSADVDEAVVFAFAQASAKMEARAAGDALVSLVAQANGAANTHTKASANANANVDVASALAASLDDNVASAKTSAALAAAFAACREDVRGRFDGRLESSGGTTILSLLALTVATGEETGEDGGLALAMGAVVDAGADLEAAVATTAQVVEAAYENDAAADVDTEVAAEVADDVRAAYSDFHADIDAVVGAALDLNEAQASVMRRTLVVSEGTWG